MKQKSLMFFVATSLVLAGAFARPGQAAEQPTLPPAAAHPRALIGPEDTIVINALDAEELSKSWRVSVTGDISLPLLGRMHVAGLTVEEVETEIAARMKRYYREPQVSVYIADFRSKPVTVAGAVDKPGTVQLDGPKRLFDVLLEAGGPKDSTSTVTVFRNHETGNGSGQSQKDGKIDVAKVRVQDVMSGRDQSANMEIKPYDVVSVSPPAQPRLVHVAGEVMRPGAVELVTQDSVSVMKIIAMAGGLSRTASPRKTMIVHVNENGVRTATAYIDLNKVLSGRVKDLELTPGDLIFVPSNQLMGYLQAASMSAVTTSVYLLGKL